MSYGESYFRCVTIRFVCRSGVKRSFASVMKDPLRPAGKIGGQLLSSPPRDDFDFSGHDISCFDQGLSMQKKVKHEQLWR
jgi:hypothetical protein